MGLPLRPLGGASAAVAAILSALAAHGCAWKQTALYTYKCRGAAHGGGTSCFVLPVWCLVAEH